MVDGGDCVEDLR